MFEAGDVVRFFSPTAGKTKYHLCLCVNQSGKNCFLFLNSRTGYRGDYVLDDGAVPGLPRSQTGNTVVSFSQVIKMDERQLSLFQASAVGRIDAGLAGELLAFARTTPALSGIDRALVVPALDQISGR